TPEHPTRNIREYPRTSYPQHKRVPPVPHPVWGCPSMFPMLLACGYRLYLPMPLACGSTI
ncbi:uncharacterized protein SPAPADRAFT_143419, partial [Spathaspora passalidarum NRRL Y-27907]